MSRQSWVALPEVAERTEGVITVGHTGLPAGFDVERLEFNVRTLHRGVIKRGALKRLGFRATRVILTLFHLE